MNPSTRMRRRRPWEDEDDEGQDATSSVMSVSTLGTIKEEHQFIQPSIQTMSHRDAPHLRLETTAPPVSEPNYAGVEYLSSTASSSPSMKRQRKDYTSSESASASAGTSAIIGSGISSVSYQFSDDRCCVPGCPGKQCERIRQLSKQLLSEILTHEILVHGTSGEGEADNGGTSVLPDVFESVLDRLSRSNHSLKKLLDASPIKPETLNKTTVEESAGKQVGPIEMPMSPVMLSASTRSSSQTQISRTTTNQSSLEELQNQLNVNILKFQTLQNEHLTLQSKMDLEKANYSELERKYDVADAEVIYLTTEKERLEQTMTALEKQIKDLEISRNEARKSSSEMASQYLRIVEMAGRLHNRDVGSDSKSPKRGDSELKIDDEESIGDPNQAKIMILEQEVKRLRSRNLQLENGAAAAKQAIHNVEWILKNALEDSDL